MEAPSFKRELHQRYFSWMLQELPGAYESHESTRLTLAYFAVSALDVLDSLDLVNAEDTIKWVYSLQVLPSVDGALHDDVTFGFRGSPLICGGSLAMTYSALAVLAILGDDFGGVSREGIVSSMRKLQRADGSFCPTSVDAQSDMRFLFCAAAISAMLDDWRGVDRDRAVEFIVRSQSFDGGFGLTPGLEAHGGATYCSLAALRLMTMDGYRLPGSKIVIDADLLKHWCVSRQDVDGGFQGRPNKPADTCYAFWVGGSLGILGIDHFCDQDRLRSFLLSTQSKWGGFFKFPYDELPDLLHSYYGICGFSMLGEPSLQPLAFELGLTRRTASRLPGFVHGFLKEEEYGRIRSLNQVAQK